MATAEKDPWSGQWRAGRIKRAQSVLSQSTSHLHWTVIGCHPRYAWLWVWYR